MATTERYYGTPFKVPQGVNQGDILSPTIFNMTVDTVIHHGVTLVAGEEAVPDGFDQVVQCLAVLFNADDGLLASPRPARIQTALDVLVGLSNRVGFHKNVKKWSE